MSPTSTMQGQPAGLSERVSEMFPGSRVEAIEPLGEAHGTGETGGIEKGAGYGSLLRVRVRDGDGTRRDLVFHRARPNDYGRDRRSDRARAMLLDYDTFGRIPGHVRALDVGAIGGDGRLRSLRDCGEFYLITEYAPGALYADDLSRIAAGTGLTDRDEARCDRLADYLCSLHAPGSAGRMSYRRAVRDLVGDGEGIFGIADGYPDDMAPALRDRLEAIESRCVEWRWRLRGYEHRASRIHGDFHPFNLVFDDPGGLTLLDASRGCAGDPADDVVCLAINYVFFALQAPASWASGFRTLWHRFWSRYQSGTGDDELVDVAAPFLAWRILVLASPVWYPGIDGSTRHALLAYAARVLDEDRFRPESVEGLFP